MIKNENHVMLIVHLLIDMDDSSATHRPQVLSRL